MRSKYVHSVVGQEVQQGELNTIAREAAEAEDRVFAELFRVKPFDGTTTYKAVIPYGRKESNASEGARHIIAQSGVADHTVKVSPFRVIVGTRTEFSSDPETALADVRSQLLVGTGSDGIFFIQLPATVANNRWDLIYARVDIDVDSSAVTRYVKAANGTQTTQAIPLYKNVSVTTAIQVGTEGATPTRPTLPSDTSSSYYVPLAYVYCGHPETLTSIVDKVDIVAAAPIAQIPSVLGGDDVRPANLLDSVAAASIATVAASNWPSGKPHAFLPSDMVGKAERFFALDFTAGTPTIPLNATTRLDDSVYWRERVFKCTIQTIKNGKIAWSGAASGSNLAVPGVSFSGGSNPGGLNQTNIFVQMGQSFVNDTSGTIPTAHGYVARLDTSNCPRNDANGSDFAASSYVRIYVDQNGYLQAQVSSTSPACVIFVWLEATGRFHGGDSPAY